MSTPGGHIELDRAVDSLHVEPRHRADLGDLDALATSIARDGLLQPLTISPDGVLICGAASYKTLDKIGYLERAATDETLPEHVRAAAQRGLEQIDAGSPVHPIYETIRNHATSPDPADEALHQAAADALARIQSSGRPKPARVKKPKDDAEGAPVQYPVRAFVVTWTELDQWWTHYDPAVLAVELTDEHVATFLRVIEQTVAFAEALQAALTKPDDTTATAPVDVDDERDEEAADGRPQLRAV